MSELATLRMRADKASAGPWTLEEGDDGISVDVVQPDPDMPGQMLTLIYNAEHDDGEYFVAAQPSVVLGLLDRIEQLEAALRDVEGFCDVIEAALPTCANVLRNTVRRALENNDD